MFTKQEDHDDREAVVSTGRLVTAETLRSAAESSSPSKTTMSPDKEEEHMSLFWRVFGGTILSISALVVITLYNNLATGISDLRTDLNKARDAQNELVKKDEFNARGTNIYDRIRTLDGLKVEFEGARECVTANSAAVEGLKKDTTAAVEEAKKDLAATVAVVKKGIEATSDQIRKDEAAVEVVKDRLTAIESLKKDVAAIEVLKEKVTAVAADLKATRDDSVKLQQEADRTRSTDLERKASQDLQFKQIDETLKEVQKGLQDCREKLARLEGALPVKPPAAKP